MTTLQDIKNLMINHLSKYEFDKETTVESTYGLYDEDGYCGPILWEQIKEFWNNFNSNKDFIYLVSGEWFGEEDLDGGRSYLLGAKGLSKMLFDYLYSTMKYSKDMFESICYNSTELGDEISDIYDDIPTIRNIKIDAITNTSIHKISEKTDDGFIVLKYPKELKHVLDRNHLFEFIGLSKLDNVSPIYKIKIPNGFEIIPSVDTLI